MSEMFFNWVKKILGITTLENENVLLNKKITKLFDDLKEEQNINEELYKENEELKIQISEIKKQLDSANEEIFYLTEFIEIDNFKNWYISRRGSQTWTYNWDNKGNKDTSLAFRYKDKKAGPTKLVEITNKIIDLYNINSPTKTEIIERVKQYFTRRAEWTYVFDHNNINHPGIADYWQEIDVSIDTRRGDCEDLTILMHMIIRTMFNLFGYEDDKWRFILTAGTMVGYRGHAYNLYLHDDGHYYVVESTFDLEGSFKRAWLKTPVVYNNLYRDFWGFATPEKSQRNFTYRQNLEALKKKIQ